MSPNKVVEMASSPAGLLRDRNCRKHSPRTNRIKKVVSKANDFETTFLILFVLGLCFRQFLSRSNPAGLLAISTTLFGLMYVPWLLNFIQKILFFPHVNGRFYILYFILVTKFSDMGAYLVGSLF